MATGKNLVQVSNPRALHAGRDTGIAKLPGLPRGVATGNASLDAWVNGVTEHLEVRAGTRGNDAERVVTQRELKALTDTTGNVQRQLDAVSSAVLGTELPMTPQEAVKRFQDSIRSLQLYKDLMKTLNDPTRFDNLRLEVRQELLRSLSDEARRLGANIQQTQKLIQDATLSLAMPIDQITASINDTDAGVRETMFATAEQGRAQAGLVLQLEASLGNYYQDGTPGRASLEEQMTVTADTMEGLTSQWTLKTQAGGAIAGIGLSATEKDGVPDSAFIVIANKFAVVTPDYAGGLTNMPDNSNIPFGIDGQGIYMNSTVYLSGLMRIQGGTKTIGQGLRGSLQLNAGTGTWSDAAASAKIWQALGNAGSPLNTDHLVIGDMVTIGDTTRYWNGSAWTSPGMVITGDLLVDGTISAPKINTNGLVIRDAFGNPILGSGVLLTADWIQNLPSNKITGLGTLATQNAARIGSTVQFQDGSTMNTADFVNRLSRIGTGNIGTFIDAAAIGSAYIGNAAIQNAHIADAQVDTLKVAGGSITSMSFGSAGESSVPAGGSTQGAAVIVDAPAGSTGVLVSASAVLEGAGTNASVTLTIYSGGRVIVSESVSVQDGWRNYFAVHGLDIYPINGSNLYTFTLSNAASGPGGNAGSYVHGTHIMATGAKR
jgi:hypothetical protein